VSWLVSIFFFFQAEDGIRDSSVTGVQTCALPICLFGGELSDIARTGNGHYLAADGIGPSSQHFLDKINQPITGRFLANTAAAPVDALSRQHPGELVAQLLVLAKQEPNLAPAHSDVACRHVRIGSDVPRPLSHEILAKPHHLV